MKFLIVFACLLAVTFANEDANVLKQEQEVEPDHFKYILELDNGVKLQQQGRLVGDDCGNVDGKFEFISPEGEKVDLAYTADETGYHPDPSNKWIHPIPEHIIRSIEYIRTHPSKE
ncbi:PREDICTED: LOW QUALITY PROTEIN: larval cuticle protein 9-like [Rhagoletis zephyria]|uniref:LOW QUALITY PROTEIN: larval cuticle protein 9-like n=1 Tax=Rhagoletis zephyria TaxID=28612 RepID=UPI0008117769|nr:PREDICTED: LOW QUALITY PROTEIN: larval cuticle protein 9-like [Rhagoletis zephyria]